jgi:hypothetical protein
MTWVISSAIDARVRTHALDAVENPNRGIGRRAGHFCGENIAILLVDQQEIGKRASDVNP